MEAKARIALLIDADNVSARRIDLILNELSGYGETSIRRAYGNWTKPELRGWAGVLHENAIRPMQQYDYTSGKNASDMALVVDAMALLYTDQPEAYAIVSSDGDFTPLVMHLREKGAAVYGFGERKTPEPFKSACSRFLVLDQLDVEEEDAAADTTEAEARPARLRVPTAELKKDAKLVTLLRRAVQGAADDDGWALVGTVGQHIANQSSFDPRNYGYAKLSKLLEATDLFDMKDEGKPTLAVRDKRRARSARR
ncbi:NYN domain-containing protein [Knoellia sp. p5-6-4]|uniref:NYN domain-containing protein n=1 Tax=unclassified Knoellia TaxID=2618719 RepID=UPI0023DA4082|nr:NYN domain-containing protein [Knoellia sp. p5-6-4]MDF2145565.1 NYN domain-containing protein [Knoellia sp. p5-6-4]